MYFWLEAEKTTKHLSQIESNGDLFMIYAWVANQE